MEVCGKGIVVLMYGRETRMLSMCCRLLYSDIMAWWQPGWEEQYSRYRLGRDSLLDISGPTFLYARC